jgi:hypothetical protein
VLAASADARTVDQLVAGRADAPIVLSFCVKGQPEQPVAEGAACALKAPPKERHLLDAIEGESVNQSGIFEAKYGITGPSHPRSIPFMSGS